MASTNSRSQDLSTAARRRWRFRIRLRTLLIAVTLFCLWCTYVALKHRAEHAAAKALAQAGATVDWQGSSPEWLTKLIGDDPFAYVREVSFVDAPVTDSDLEHLQSLPTLQKLYIAQNNTFTGTGLRYLAGMNDLTMLYIYDVPMTDEGLRALPPLPRLAELYVLATCITDEGVEHVRRFPAAKEIQLGSEQLTKNAVSKLGAELPNAQVGWSGQGYSGSN
jgi:hypothetical protein